MAEGKSYKVGEHEVVIALPKSFQLRHEIWRCAAANGDRAYGAALAACWQGKGRPKVRYESCDYNPLLFGGRVIDELVERGVSMDTIREVGTVAWLTIARSMKTSPPPTAKEVEDAEGFTGPATGSSTS